jgi:hypothetical protein
MASEYHKDSSLRYHNEVIVLGGNAVVMQMLFPWCTGLWTTEHFVLTRANHTRVKVPYRPAELRAES